MLSLRWIVAVISLGLVVAFAIDVPCSSQAAASEWRPLDSTRAVEGLVEVGTTKDACAGSNAVSFHAKDGKVVVNASESKLVELPAFTRELHWYCGDSRERCANDHPFNFVKCERAGSGAIQWVFYAKR